MTADRYILAVAAATAVAWALLAGVLAVRDERFRSRLLLLMAGSVILLARLPAFFGAQTAIQALVIGVLLTGAALASRGRGRWTLAAGAVFLYSGTILVALLRGAREGVYQTLPAALVEGTMYLTVVAFALTLTANAESDRTRNQRMAALALAPAFYCVANAGLFAMGVTSRAELGIATESTASLLELVGISINRVQFAFATAVNSMGIVSALGVASCLVLLVRRAAPIWATAVGLVGSLTCLVLSDTRAALIISLVVAVWFAWGKRTIGAKWIALAVPLLPVIFMWLIARSENTVVGDLLNRDAGEFTTAGGRIEVWNATWQTIKHFSPHHLFGWGANGQITSGASFDYAHVFAGQDQPWRFSTHDIALQTVLDMGVFGLFALMLAIFVAASSLQAQRLPAAPALLTIIVASVLCGTTEVSPSYGSSEALLATLLAMGAAAGVAPERHSVREKRRSPTGASESAHPLRLRAP